MKRLICSILIATLAMTAFTAYPIGYAETNRYGDGNGDGKANASDALIVLKVAVGKETADDQTKTNLDVDGSGNLDASDALLILKYAVAMIDRFPVDQGTQLVQDDSQWLTMSMDEIIDTIDGETEATPVSDAYETHSDGGLIYNPLSRQMDSGDKTKYNTAEKTTGTVKMADGTTLSYSLPTDVTAYDMIPIEYTLSGNQGTDPVYVEATTFEDQDGSYYDLCLPGNVAVDVEYEGYIAATANGQNRPYLSANLESDTQGTQYPQYDTNALVASDTVAKSQYLWFQFKVTNTGDTILDGDGNGTFCFQPSLVSKTSDKTYGVANDYIRITEDLYPGESTRIYVYFNSNGPNNLPADEYDLTLTTIVRNEEDTSHWTAKIWGGYTYGKATQKITIGDTAGTSIQNQIVNQTLRTGTRNTWLHTYEEFTTSFDAWLQPAATHKSTLYVQSAAWSDRVVLKLMKGNGDNMVSATVPLNVESDSISIKLNETASNYIVTDDGTKYPALASQSMADMRVNISQDPDAATKQLDELLDMKECGVNLVTTTMAFNIATTSRHSSTPADAQDSNWFMCDMARKLGMRLEGFTSYPYGESSVADKAYWYTRDRQFRSFENLGLGTPTLAIAEALRGLYQFERWGKNYYVNSDNLPVIVTEDTRGWMRIDFAARKPMGTATLTAFQEWCQERYGTIEALNEAWDMAYADFSEIDPEDGAGDDHGWFSLVYGNSYFYDWSVATNDLDIFRTLDRTNSYATLLSTMKTYGEGYTANTIPTLDATMGIRTEGGNVTGVVPYDTDNSHFRHTYYSQRRCALIPQILAKSGTVSMHSDYVTLPYTPDEWATLVSSSTSLGITSMPLLQANRMRDIILNDTYTAKIYDVEYNLSGENIYGEYINTQVSVFQSFKAIYENGGIPGVLWEDYLCDGYVTETQQKEMKFYSSKIAEMMETDAAKAWAATDVPDVQSVYAKATGEYAYTEEFLDAALTEAMKNR